MTSLQVALEIPAEIAAKLTSGDWVRDGGVIRDTLGRVRAILKDGGVVEEVARQVPSGLLGSGVMLGLQAVNTAISVAGFAMLAAKLSAVSEQCDAILDRMSKVDRHLQWLRDAGIANVQTRILAGLEGAQSAHKLGQSVLPYDTAINEGALFFRRILKDALGRGDALNDTEMFLALVVQHGVATTARARAQWLLHGPEEGLAVLGLGLKAHEEVVAWLRRLLRDPFAENSPLLDLTATQRGALKGLAVVLQQTSKGLERQRVELEAFVACGLTSPPSVEAICEFESHPTACMILNTPEYVYETQSVAGR